MASSSNSSVSERVLSRHLEQEEVDWLRDLAHHRGFLLYQQACQEIMELAFNRLRGSKDHDEMVRAQERYNTMETVLRLPYDLTKPTSERRQE